jgi:hypothetical protein
MDANRFLKACRIAEELVVPIQDPAYRTVAYGVAVQAIMSEGRTTSSLETRASTAGEEPAPKAVKSDTKRRILDLKTEGYFGDPRLPSEVRSELRVRGFHHNPGDVRMALLRLAQDKTLRRVSDGGNNFRYAQP